MQLKILKVVYITLSATIKILLLTIHKANNWPF